LTPRTKRRRSPSPGDSKDTKRTKDGEKDEAKEKELDLQRQENLLREKLLRDKIKKSRQTSVDARERA